jgi:hypothetical protein
MSFDLFIERFIQSVSDRPLWSTGLQAFTSRYGGLMISVEQERFGWRLIADTSDRCVSETITVIDEDEVRSAVVNILTALSA